MSKQFQNWQHSPIIANLDKSFHGEIDFYLCRVVTVQGTLRVREKLWNFVMGQRILDY